MKKAEKRRDGKVSRTGKKMSGRERKRKEPEGAEKETKEKRASNGRIVNRGSLAFVVVVALVTLYFFGSIQDDGTSPESDKYSVKTGDKVYIRFIQKLENGTVIDTNYEDVAVEAGIEEDKYPPLVFIVGKGQVPEGLENAVIGMKVWDKKTAVLQPEDAYGVYKEELAGVAERVQYQDRNVTVVSYESLRSDDFTELFRKEAAILGDTVSAHAIPWDYMIVDIAPDNITLKALIDEGGVYRLPDMVWNSTAIDVGEYETIFRQDPPDGMIVPTQLGNATVTTSEDAVILTINPQIGDVYLLEGIPAKVTELDDDHIILDANHPLAGKTIVFDIELIQIVKASKSEDGVVP